MMKKNLNRLGYIFGLFISFKYLYQTIKQGENISDIASNWKTYVFGLLFLLFLISIFTFIKSKIARFLKKDESLKKDEFLKFDNLILDKDVNKAIEENALTSVKSQKSKDHP